MLNPSQSNSNHNLLWQCGQNQNTNDNEVGMKIIDINIEHLAFTLIKLDLCYDKNTIKSDEIISVTFNHLL